MKKIWTTKDNRNLKVKSLETSHIQNILRLFSGKMVSDERAEQLEAVLMEAKRRGLKEGVKYKLESEWIPSWTIEEFDDDMDRYQHT